MRHKDPQALGWEQGRVETIDDRAFAEEPAVRERLRLGRLLHDDIQQRLYSLRIQLIDVRDGMLRASPAPRALVEALEAADVTLLGTIHAVRQLTADLASPDEGMHEALAAIGAHMRSLHGMTVEISCGLGTPEPSRSAQATLARVIRELLFNVVKHAGVAAARVSAWSDGDVLHLEVRDEGRGFTMPAGPTPAGADDGFGLRDARASLRGLGGDMTVATSPGMGTSVRLAVPLQEGARPA